MEQSLPLFFESHNMKSFLIVGGGSIGKRHLRNLLELGEKNISTVEVNKDRAQEVAREFSICTYSSLDEAFAVQKFDCVFICSPTIYHLEQTKKCAEQGADIFIEKPVSHDLEGVEEVQKIISEKNLITLVGSNWKFYPLFQKMKEILENGRLGKVVSARCEFGQYLPDWHPWEDYRKGYSANKKLGGGVLLDSHEFDYMTWFLGRVERVACIANKVSDLEIDVEDVAEVALQFESSAVGEIHLDYLQRTYRRNFEFFCENGTMDWDVHDKKIKIHEKGKPLEEILLDENYDVNQMYLEQTKHFLVCVEKRQETITPFEKGVEVLKLISAAKDSSEQNKIMSV